MTKSNIYELVESRLTDSPLNSYLSLLSEIIHSFSSSLKLEHTLHTTICQVLDYLDGEAASVFLLGNDDRELFCKVCVGPVDISGLRIPSTSGIVGRAVIERRTQMIRDTRTEKDFFDAVDEQTGFETRSILCAPLLIKDACIGALEVINKRGTPPLFNEQDQSVLNVLAGLASLAIHNARMAESLVEQERMQKELEMAREIQEGLLPNRSPDSFPLHGINIPAREVSGDFFDWYVLSDGQIFFTLGDVSGKGMNAALLMATTVSLLHCLGKTTDSLPTMMAQVNNEICESARRGMFVTAIAGIYHPRTQTVQWVNAGHQPPLFHHSNGSFEEIPADTPPLGIIPNLSFDQSERTIDNGTLYLFTDGVTESKDGNGKTIDVGGMINFIKASQQLPARQRLQNIVDRVTGYNTQQHDDVTMLLIESVSR